MKAGIPSSLETLGVLPVTFDNNLGKFVVGASRQLVEPQNFHDLVNNDDYMAVPDIPRLSAGIVLRDAIVTGPVFHDFIETDKAGEVIKETPQVMLAVFNTVSTFKANKSHIGGFSGFDVQRFREGQVNLSVFGDCACFAPDLYGPIVRPHEWEMKFAEYTEHDIGFPAQIISLYAGIGYIAGKAIEYSNN